MTRHFLLAALFVLSSSVAFAEGGMDGAGGGPQWKCKNPSFVKPGAVQLTYHLAVQRCSGSAYCANYVTPNYAGRNHTVQITCDPMSGCTGDFSDVVSQDGITFVAEGKIHFYGCPNHWVSVIGRVYEQGHRPETPTFNSMARTPEQLGEVLIWGTPVNADNVTLTPAFSVGEMKF